HHGAARTLGDDFAERGNNDSLGDILTPPEAASAFSQLACSVLAEGHSYRRAIAGSMPVARRAGIYADRRATSAKIAATAAKLCGSFASTPNNRLPSTRVVP